MDTYFKYVLLEVVSVFGSYLVFKKGKFPDFGILATYLVSSYVGASLYESHWPTLLIPIAGIIVGLIFSVLTTSLHFKFGINALLSGICSLFFAYSICVLLFDNAVYKSPIEAELFSPRSVGNIFGPILLIVCLLYVIIENTVFGTKLRASSFTETKLNYLGINKELNLTVYIIAGNCLIGLNSSLRFIVEKTASLTMTNGILEQLLVQMVIGLFILDIIVFTLHRFFNSNFISKPSSMRLFELFIPISGTLVYQLFYFIFTHYYQNSFHLKALIAALLILLIWLARKLSLARYSNLKFIGIDA